MENSEPIKKMRQLIGDSLKNIPEWVKKQERDELLYGIPSPKVRTKDSVIVLKR